MIDSKNWHAWLNLTPPKPDDFHVVGQVKVPNPGVIPVLLAREPQGFNPTILLLELHLVQQAGMWPQVVSWATARYDEIIAPGQPAYKHVRITAGTQDVAELSVDQVGAPARSLVAWIDVEFKAEPTGVTYEVWVNGEPLRFVSDKATAKLVDKSEFRLDWRMVGAPGSKLTIKYKPHGRAEKTAAKDSTIPDGFAEFADFTKVQL